MREEKKAEKECRDGKPSDDRRTNHEGPFPRSGGILDAEVRPDDAARDSERTAYDSTDDPKVHGYPVSYNASQLTEIRYARLDRESKFA